MDEMFNPGEDSVGMTDYQFAEYQKVCIERDALREEVRALRKEGSACDESGMTDYQFQQYEKLRDEREKSLRQEIARLQGGEPAPNPDDMTDHQTKILLAAIADMLNSSADINEARTRFNAISGGGFARCDTARQS